LRVRHTQVTFLGTGAAVPSARRALPAVAIRTDSELVLFDCGEGTQRQMVAAGTGFPRLMKIFVTHMHGDHVLGLPGLLQTMSLLDRTEPVQVFGPTGLRRYLDSVCETVNFHLTFPISISEVEKEGVVDHGRNYQVAAAWADHSVPCLAYALIEKERPGRFFPDRAERLGVPKGPLWSRLRSGEKIKLPNDRIVKPRDVMGSSRPGRKIVYSGDTRPSPAITMLATGADLLIHDCSFSQDLADKAREDGHSTASEAATLAKKAKVKQLVLFHISARYEDASVLEKEASRIFPRALVASDLLRLDIPSTD